MSSVTNAQILSAVEGLGDKIDAVNGRVREHETTIAVLGQRTLGQEKGLEDLEDEVRGLRSRQNLFTGLLATVQLLMTAVFGVKDV